MGIRIKSIGLLGGVLASLLVTVGVIAGPWQDGINNPSGGSKTSVPNYTPNGGLPHWKACLASFKAGTSSACNSTNGPVVMVIGDSQSTGHGAFQSATGNDAHSGSWANVLAGILNNPPYSLAATANTFVGTNNITPTTAYDARLTPNGWAAFTAIFVPGQNLWANTNTTPLVFNPTDYQAYPLAVPVQTNSIDVYWAGNVGDANIVVAATQNSGTSGTATTTSTTLTFASAPSVAPTTGASAFIYGPGIAVGTTVSAYNSGTRTMTLSAVASVPAGSTLSFNPSTIGTITGDIGSFVMKKTTFTTPLGPNVYTLSCSSATASLCSPGAVNVYNSNTKAISIFQAGADGSTSTLWATNNGYPTDPAASMATYLPDLIVFGTIVNDAVAQTSLATYAANLTYIANTSKSAVAGVSGKSVDVLFTTGLPVDGDTTPITIEQYQAQVITTAATLGVPVWDSMATYGGNVTGWLASLPRGWIFDADHYSIGGYSYEAGIYAQILTQ